MPWNDRMPDESPAAAPRPAPWRTLAIALLWFLAASLAAVPFVMLAHGGRFPKDAAAALAALLVPAVLALPLLRTGEAASLLRTKLAHPWRVVGVLVLVLQVNQVMLWLLPVPVADIGPAMAHGRSAWTWLSLAGIAVAAPLGEELFFRGWLWARLSRAWEPGAVALATGTAFALAHAHYAFSVVPLAIALTWLRATDGSVRAPLALHLAINSLSVAATVAGG